MAAYITHVLERAVCPALNRNLRMLHTACDTEVDVLLVTGNSVHETCILTAERTADSVTDVVAECADSIEHVCVRLEGDLLSRIRRSLRSPTLTVDNHCRVDRVETLADDVHGLDVMDGHEVETEAIDMVFLHPPLERLDHVLAEHFLL